MKRLLVTGASGFLGGRVADFYHEKYEVYAPAHREMDIVDREQVIARLREWKPDVVVHCAAISNIGRCETEPEHSWKINVNGSVNIAEGSRLVDAKCLLCSSDQVYSGSVQNSPRREQETLTPDNLYGREKLYAEAKCLEVNPDCVHLRLSWMYDSRTLHTGEHSDFVRNLLAKADTSEKLTYSVWDKRGITDVNEVVRNLEAAFALEGGIYNFGSPNEKNMYETVRGLFTKLNWDTERLIKSEDFAEEPRNLAMSQKKLNDCGICFADTEDALVRCLQDVMRG